MALTRPYSLRIIHDPPITLYQPPSWTKCTRAFKKKAPIEVASVECVAETEGYITVLTATGKQYSRRKTEMLTFHTEIQAIQATIADLEGMKRYAEPRSAEHIANVITYLRDSRRL